MAALINQWVGHVSQMFAGGRADELVASVSLDPSHPFWGPLKQSLSSIPSSSLTIESVLPHVNVISPETRETFASFLISILKYVRGDSSEHGGPKDQVDIAIGDFQRLVQAYSDANRLYGMSGSDGSYSHPFMNPLILYFIRTLVTISNAAARISPHPPRSPISARSIRDTTRQTVERSFQVASSSMTEMEWSDSVGRECAVGDILWKLANILWRIYAERKLHTQATELAKSISSLNPREDKRLASRGTVIRQTDLCQSYYWRGRLGVVLLDMRNAKFWLDKACSVCPASAWQQRRAILIRLIPVNLLLGRLPTTTFLQTHHLDAFTPLLHAFRTGNLPAWRRELDINREWYRSRSIWLLLYERGEILVWRNVLRQSLKLYYRVYPDAPKNRCPTRIFVAAASKAFEGSGELEDGSIVLEDVICVMSSLIDQSLILGNLSYSQQQLVMKPSADGMGGFPKVSSVTPRRIEANV